MRLSAEKRREKVRLLLAKGYTISTIAKECGCIRQTVYHDIALLKKDAKKLNTKPIEEFLFEFTTQYDAVQEQLWKVYSSTDRGHTQTTALGKIAELQEKKKSLLQDVGIIEKTPDKHEVIGVTHETFAEAWENVKKAKQKKLK